MNGSAHEPLRYLARIGLWGDARGWLRRYSPPLAFAQSLFGLLSQTINVAQTWGKMALVTEFCITFLLMLMACVKISCLLAYSGPIQEIVATLDELQAAHAQAGDVADILRRTRGLSDMLARGLHAFCAVSAFGFTLAVTIAGYMKGEILYRRWFPFNSAVSPMFELTLIVYWPLAFLDFYLILLFDLVFLCLVLEVIGEFKILQHRLTHFEPFGNVALNMNIRVRRGHPKGKLTNKQGLGILVKVAPVGVNKKSLPKGVKRPPPRGKVHIQAPHWGYSPERRLAASVVHHVSLFRLVSKIESTFQPGLAVNLVCSLSVGLTLAYASLQDAKMDLKMVGMLATGMICVAEFAVYCFLCTQLTVESHLVGEVLYSCSWWDARASFKRSLRIVLLQTGRPLYIRAAAIFPMSMETFAKVMHTAYNMYGLMITTN